MCAAINQLAFPGLGTIMAGRRIGYLQAVIMVVGFVLTTGFMLWFIVIAVRHTLNTGGPAPDFAALSAPYAWIGKSGSALSLLAWCWSLVSSINVLRAARKTPPALPVT